MSCEGAFAAEKGSEARLLESWKAFFDSYRENSGPINELEALCRELSLADNPDFYSSESLDSVPDAAVSIHNARIHAEKALETVSSPELFEEECSLLAFHMNDYLLSTVESNRLYLFQFVELLTIISILSVVFVFGGIAWVKSKKKMEALAEKYRQEQLVTATIAKVQESERNRISHDLHDTVTQDIRTALMFVRQLDNSQSLTEDQKIIVSKIKHLDEQNMKNIRNIIRNLTPPEIENSNFTTLLADFSASVRETSGITCKFYAEESELYKKLSSDQKLHIFRIVQECVNNAIKHSGAGEISIIVREESNPDDGGKSLSADRNPLSGRCLVFLVSDDGCGIATSKSQREAENVVEILERNTHLGINGMKSRASMIGAKLEIQSDGEVGTLVRLSVPL
ncbi:MAG: hypothetical protein K5930_12520 [Treponemataceae bacterium]|nr:hypothetical protein [Treponemataceae bacterium]